MAVAERGVDPTDYFRTRMPVDPRRRGVWREIVRYLARYFPADGAVLEIGAGYCDCINAVPAKRRIALDRWEDVRRHAAEGVETIVGECTEIPGLAPESLDVVVASNLFEHLTREELDATLRRIRTLLKAGGRLIAIQPNYRLDPKRYFDDPTHRLIFTEASLCATLEENGLPPERVEARFLPLTLRGRLPARPWLVRLYLSLPLRPLAGQMLIVCRKPKDPTSLPASPPGTRAGAR